MDIEKLEKWVNEHPEAADARTINMSTMEEFTIREVLEELKMEKQTGAKSLKGVIRDVEMEIDEWLKEI